MADRWDELSERIRDLEAREFILAGAGGPGINAAEGTIYWDITNDDLYVNDDGVGGWTFIGGGGGAIPHNLLNGAVHPDTVAQGASTGSIIYGNATPAWDELIIGAAHTLLKVNALGTLPAWSAFDWDDISAAAGADMVHSHTNNAEGGVLGGAALPHTLLDGTAHTDTAIDAVTRGSLIYGNATPAWDELNHPLAANRVLQTTAVDVQWSAQTLTLTTSLTNQGANGILNWSGAFTLTIPATGTAVLGGGSGANTRVAYWTDANTISSDAGWTYNAATDTFTLAGGMTLTGGANATILVNDNAADVLGIHDAGGLEYLRVRSTDTQPRLLFDPGNPILNTEFILGGTTHTANDPVMICVRTVTDDYPGANAHCFVDQSTVNRSGPIGYNSFDCEIDVTGTWDYDHVVGFQARPAYYSTGTIDRFMGFVALLDVHAGTVTELQQYRARDADLYGGAVGTQYAYYIFDTLTIGTANWGFYDNGSNDHRFGKRVFVNETTNANMTRGLTIDQEGSDDEIVNLRSTSDVGAVFASVETGTFGMMKKPSPTAGGLIISGYRDSDSDPNSALMLRGYLAENVDTTKSSAGRALVEIIGYETNGTAVQNTVADGNVLCVITYVGGADTTVWILDEDGDTWQDGNVVLTDDAWIGLGAAAGRIEFDDQAIDEVNILDAYVGVGTSTPGNAHVYVFNSTLTSTSTFYGLRTYHIKTAGAGDPADDYYGINSYMSLEQATTIDNIYGSYVESRIDNAGATADIVYGAGAYATVISGTVSAYVIGVGGVADIDGGTINGPIAGVRAYVDIEAAATCNDEIYGVYVYIDDDDNTSTSYLVYLDGQSNVDFGVFQNSTEDNFFNGYVGSGTFDPDRQLHSEVEDANSATITYVSRLTHSYSGGAAAAALFGVGMEYELEDAGGNMQVASEQVAMWARATAGSEAPLLRFANYPTGSIGPGYMGYWTYPAVNAVVDVIPNGAGDCDSAGYFSYVVENLTTNETQFGSVGLEQGGVTASDIFSSAGDILTLRLNADGSVDVRTTGGTDNYDVVIFGTWL